MRWRSLLHCTVRLAAAARVRPRKRTRQAQEHAELELVLRPMSKKKPTLLRRRTKTRVLSFVLFFQDSPVTLASSPCTLTWSGDERVASQLSRVVGTVDLERNRHNVRRRHLYTLTEQIRVQGRCACTRRTRRPKRRGGLARTKEGIASRRAGSLGKPVSKIGVDQECGLHLSPSLFRATETVFS